MAVMVSAPPMLESPRADARRRVSSWPPGPGGARGVLDVDPRTLGLLLSGRSVSCRATSAQAVELQAVGTYARAEGGPIEGAAPDHLGPSAHLAEEAVLMPVAPGQLEAAGAVE